MKEKYIQLLQWYQNRTTYYIKVTMLEDMIKDFEKSECSLDITCNETKDCHGSPKCELY